MAEGFVTLGVGFVGVTEVVAEKDDVTVRDLVTAVDGDAVRRVSVNIQVAVTAGFDRVPVTVCLLFEGEIRSVNVFRHRERVPANSVWVTVTVKLRVAVSSRERGVTDAVEVTVVVRDAIPAETLGVMVGALLDMEADLAEYDASLDWDFVVDAEGVADLLQRVRETLSPP